MGLFDDLGGGLKKVAKATGSGVKNAGGALVNEEAWSRALPGGKPLRMQDVANMALDATILVPGAGIAGGAARIAAKKAVQEGGEIAARKVAKKELVSSLRSPVNNKIRGKVASKQKDLVSKVTGGAHTVPKAAAGKARGAGEAQLKRVAAKQKAGVGTKVGMGQTKKRVLRNTALVGGANALETNYDALKAMLGGGGAASGGRKSGTGGAGTGAGGTGAAGSLFMMGADGEQVAVPQEFAKALAAFMAQGGSPDGQQVIHMAN